MPTALITGASGGIGYELAKVMAAARHDLILVARNESLLSKAVDECRHIGVNASYIVADLASPDGPRQIFERTSADGTQVDVLVNNAGFGCRGFFTEVEASIHLEIIQVNISALTHLSRLYLPEMLRRGRGGIINVASTAAFVPGPLMSVYYASKAFVLSFSEALANEAKGTGVVISCLCPGATTTGFQKRAKMDSTKLFEGPTVMDAASVAKLGFEGFRKGQSVVVTGLFNQLAVATSRVVPRATAADVARKLTENRQ